MSNRANEPWEVRLFRCCVRFIPTRFGWDIKLQIVSLFEDRLAACKGGQSARVGLLFRSVVDALWHGLVGWTDAVRIQPRRKNRVPVKTRVGAVSSLFYDVRYAVRSPCRRPLFTTIAVAALALGIGGTTAMFSIVDSVLIKDLPYRDSGRLVRIWMAIPNSHAGGEDARSWDPLEVRPADYLSFHNLASTLNSVAAFQEAFEDGEAVLTGEGVPEALSVYQVSANFFETVGVQPIIGRTFLPEEAIPGGDFARVAILSSEIWQRRFEGRQDVLDRTILLNDIPFEIVGVLPKGFRVPSDPYDNSPNAGAVDDGASDVWIPLGEGCGLHCGGYYLELVARLAAAASIEQARAEVQTLLTEGGLDQMVARVVPSKEIITRGFGTPLSILLGAAVVLMLIACTNVAGMLLGESTSRHRELTVRSAIGASRTRIVCLLMTESLLLGLMGAGLGVVVAWLSTDPLLALAPAMPRLDEIRIDVRVLLFATTAGIGTGVLLGVVPALSQSKESVGPTLRTHGRVSRARSLQSAVVSAQVGLTVVLLVVGGLFVRSFVRIMSVDTGFDPQGLATLSFPAPSESRVSERERASFFAEILQVTREVPGVSAVSATTSLPFPGEGQYHRFGFARNGEQIETTEQVVTTDPTYHETLRIPLLRGRFLSESDDRTALGAMLVSESLANRHWPNESPLGARVRANHLDWTVVGVVGDIRQEALGIETRPTFYVPLAQVNRSLRNISLVVRTSADAAVTHSAVRDAIWLRYPDLHVGDPNTMVGLIRDSEADERFRALLMWTFAALAAILAAVGIFGVTARAAAARTREMGIRTALGADSNGLIRLVLKEGLLSASLGLLIGLVVALWAARFIGHLLYEIGTRDPLTFMGAAIASFAVCSIAAYAPARRVTRIEPMKVLAEE